MVMSIELWKGNVLQIIFGELSERLMEPVLKTGEGNTSLGSNPSLCVNLNGMRKETTWRSTQVVEGAPLERE